MASSGCPWVAEKPQIDWYARAKAADLERRRAYAWTRVNDAAEQQHARKCLEILGDPPPGTRTDYDSAEDIKHECQRMARVGPWAESAPAQPPRADSLGGSESALMARLRKLKLRLQDEAVTAEGTPTRNFSGKGGRVSSLIAGSPDAPTTAMLTMASRLTLAPEMKSFAEWACGSRCSPEEVVRWVGEGFAPGVNRIRAQRIGEVHFWTRFDSTAKPFILTVVASVTPEKYPTYFGATNP